METSENIDYVIIQEENGQPVKRPRNWLYEQVAASQKRRLTTGPRVWPPLVEIKGEPLSETIIRERRGDLTDFLLS